jgi:hypothetical protein
MQYIRIKEQNADKLLHAFLNNEIITNRTSRTI